MATLTPRPAPRWSTGLSLWALLLTYGPSAACDPIAVTPPDGGPALPVDSGTPPDDTPDTPLGDGGADDDAPAGDAGAGDANADAGPTPPAQAACAGGADGPIKVFILAGQSNMVGAGTVTPNAAQLERNGGKGTLEYLLDDPTTRETFQHLRSANGEWVQRDDVWIVDLNRAGKLSVGYGANEQHFGPELEFGHVVGDFFESQVLIIKTAWGGKSLDADFRPPSSGGDLGPYYTMMVDRVHQVLDNLADHLPGYEGQGYEIVGFGWHQGWNDRINQAANDAYQTNCVNLINDLREELAVADMPFVLATTGMSGWEETHPRALSLMNAQLAVPTDPNLRAGKVAAVETRDFYRPPEESPANQGYHWNRNAETYFLIGKGMGEAMLELVCD